MKNISRRYIGGFTLIELLVVVLIIGILSAIALPQYTMAVEKARLAEALQNIAVMKRNIEEFLLTNPADVEVDYQDFEMIELGGGYWNDGVYVTDHFVYNGVTNAAVATRYTGDINTEGAEGLYMLQVMKEGTGNEQEIKPVGGWYQGCHDFGTTIGSKICKQLESQGWSSF